MDDALPCFALGATRNHFPCQFLPLLASARDMHRWQQVCVCISEDTLKNAQRACILLDSPQKGCMTWHDMISLNMLNKLKSIHLPTSDLMADLSGYVCAGGVYMEYWKSRGDNWRPKYDYGAALSALSSSRSVIHQDWAKKATDGPLSDPAWLLLSHKVWNPRRCLELLEMFGVWVCEQDDQWFLKLSFQNVWQRIAAILSAFSFPHSTFEKLCGRDLLQGVVGGRAKVWAYLFIYRLSSDVLSLRTWLGCARGESWLKKIIHLISPATKYSPHTPPMYCTVQTCADRKGRRIWKIQLNRFVSCSG